MQDARREMAKGGALLRLPGPLKPLTNEMHMQTPNVCEFVTRELCRRTLYPTQTPCNGPGNQNTPKEMPISSSLLLLTVSQFTSLSLAPSYSALHLPSAALLHRQHLGVRLLLLHRRLDPPRHVPRAPCAGSSCDSARSPGSRLARTCPPVCAAQTPQQCPSSPFQTHPATPRPLAARTC